MGEESASDRALQARSARVTAPCMHWAAEIQQNRSYLVSARCATKLVDHARQVSQTGERIHDWRAPRRGLNSSVIHGSFSQAAMTARTLARSSTRTGPPVSAGAKRAHKPVTSCTGSTTHSWCSTTLERWVRMLIGADSARSCILSFMTTCSHRSPADVESHPQGVCQGREHTRVQAPHRRADGASRRPTSPAATATTRTRNDALSLGHLDAQHRRDEFEHTLAHRLQGGVWRHDRLELHDPNCRDINRLYAQRDHAPYVRKLDLLPRVFL